MRAIMPQAETVGTGMRRVYSTTFTTVVSLTVPAGSLKVKVVVLSTVSGRSRTISTVSW